MEFGEWEKFYNNILNDFEFDKQDDIDSSKILDDLLFSQGCLSLEDLYQKIHNCRDTSKFIVFGAGPSLKDTIIKLKEEIDLDEYILIAADGATTALIEERLIPDIIVTDLDGRIDDILLANSKDSSIVVHAHGDNSENILKYVPFFDNVLGTTQSEPHGNVYNFGGFTDGDRAIFLAVALGASEINLVGMDFGDVVTRYSRPNNPRFLMKADETKKRKLEYAEELTNWINENENVDLISLK